MKRGGRSRSTSAASILASIQGCREVEKSDRQHRYDRCVGPSRCVGAAWARVCAVWQSPSFPAVSQTVRVVPASFSLLLPTRALTMRPPPSTYPTKASKMRLCYDSVARDALYSALQSRRCLDEVEPAKAGRLTDEQLAWL